MVVCVTALINSCKTNPDSPSDPIEGKRNYVWTVDTLSYPGSFQTSMQDMWASSPNDVYVVGHNDLNRGQMYHFDGVRWSPVHLSVNDGGTISGPIDLSAVHGLTKNNIWAVGERLFLNPTPPPNIIDSSLVIHFDGTYWREQPTNVGSPLWNIWINSLTDVWVVGPEGNALQYDGVIWNSRPIGRDYFFNSIVRIRSGEVMTAGYREDWMPPNDSAGSFLFVYDSTGWRQLDSAILTPDMPARHFGGILYSDGISIYSTAPNIYRYVGSNWEKIFTGTVGHMYKSSDNNIFAVGSSIYHFNGVDWAEISGFLPFGPIWRDCYADGNEVFIVGNDAGRTYILHGK